MSRKVVPLPVNEVIGPAKLHPGHVRDHAFDQEGNKAGGRRGWRNINESPLSRAYEKGQLSRGVIKSEDNKNLNKFNAKDRYNAGEFYRDIWEASQDKTRDSTDLDVVQGGRSGPISEKKADATKKLIAIDSRLNQVDRKIVRRVCGEGWWPSEAVAEACGIGYRHATVTRFNEALDNLIEAQRAAFENNWTVVLTRL